MADQPTGIGEDDLWTDSDCSPGVYYCELVTRFNGNLSLCQGGPGWNSLIDSFPSQFRSLKAA
jgi:hypothetical protein